MWYSIIMHIKTVNKTALGTESLLRLFVICEAHQIAVKNSDEFCE